MVRFATNDDLPFLKKAWDVCFHDPAEFIEWNFRRNFSAADTLIATLDGTPASNMQLMPHRIQLRGRQYPINYISGVATLPAYRRKGLVRELFAFAFPEMLRRGDAFSLLVPFDYPFYEKFGYKQCYEKVFRYAENLPRKQFVTAKDLSPALIARLDRIYRREMLPKDGYALRSNEDWQRILEDLLLVSKGKILFHQTGAYEDGYALLGPMPCGGFELYEMFGPCEIPFRSEKKPFAMARILDLRRALADIGKDFKGCWRIKVVDENIPANNQTLALENGQVLSCSAYDTEINIRQLTQLLFGCIEDFTGTGLFTPTDPYLNMIF